MLSSLEETMQSVGAQVLCERELLAGKCGSAFFPAELENSNPALICARWCGRRASGQGMCHGFTSIKVCARSQITRLVVDLTCPIDLKESGF